jgi:hypothetical protein
VTDRQQVQTVILNGVVRKTLIVIRMTVAVGLMHFQLGARTLLHRLYHTVRCSSQIPVLLTQAITITKSGPLVWKSSCSPTSQLDRCYLWRKRGNDQKGSAKCQKWQSAKINGRTYSERQQNCTLVRSIICVNCNTQNDHIHIKLHTATPCSL